MSDVAGHGDDAQNTAFRIFVHTGVVEDLGQLARLVSDRQRIVGDGALGERFLVTLTGLGGLGEVVAEVRPDERLSRSPRDLDRSLVDVGDLALGADRDQRIQAGLDEAARILRIGPSLLLGVLACRDVDADRTQPNEGTLAVIEGRRRDGDANRLAVFAQAWRLVVGELAANTDLGEQSMHLCGPTLAEDGGGPA